MKFTSKQLLGLLVVLGITTRWIYEDYRKSASETSSQVVQASVAGSALANTTEESKINWVSIEKIQELQKKQPRKVMVDVYTDWCGWCKVMDRKTFSNQEVIDYVNKNFYAVKFNAEGTSNVIYYDKVYKFNSGANVHELAIKWLGARMGFPTIAYLDEKGELIEAQPGYKDPQQLKDVLTSLNKKK